MKKHFAAGLILFVFLLLLLSAGLSDSDEVLTIPGGVTVIEEEAFCGNAAIREIELPWGVQRIESRAFAGTSVGWVYLPSSLNYIAPDAFDRGVIFGMEEGSYAWDWVQQTCVFEIVPERCIPRFAMFDDGVLYNRLQATDAGLYGGHGNAVLTCTIPDYWNLTRFREGTPVWNAYVSEGSASVACHDWESGCWIEVTEYPAEPSEITYCVTCDWAGEQKAVWGTLKFETTDRLPIGANIPDRIYLRQNTPFSLTFRPAYAGEPFSNILNAECFPEDDADWVISKEGPALTLTPLKTGVFYVNMGVADCNIRVMKEVKCVVEEENPPLQAVAVATDRYGIYLLPGQDLPEGVEATVRAFTDEDCTEWFREVTQVPEDHWVWIDTDTATQYWFTADYNGTVLGPATTMPLDVPDAPAQFTATVTEDNRILLTWENVEGASAYRVYWSYEAENGENFREWTMDMPWVYASSGYDELTANGPVALWVCAETEEGPGRRAWTSVEEMPDDIELLRALSLELGSNVYMERTVTLGEFVGMLDRVIGLSGNTPLQNWIDFRSSARSSSQLMTRREGMVATYLAAESLGEHFYQYNNITQGVAIYNEIASGPNQDFWNEMHRGNYSLFPNVLAATLNGEDSYVNAGYFYSMRRISLSGKIIFDYDQANRTMRPADPFTYREALLAAIRLRDSYIEEAPRPLTEADQQILQDADEMREEILNSTTSVSVTGTCYYVSAAGSDSNSGKSASSPWATLSKVNSANLQPGDGVFFRRGDVWRGALIAKTGVTYSAYGTGEKPAIYGSPESGTGSGKWSLLSGTGNIWVFHKKIMDCGDIVVNGNMNVFDKAPVWWTGSKYVLPEGNESHDTLMNKRTFDPARDLKNHQYFNDISWSGLGTSHPIAVFRNVDRTGTLYVRCDEGNPGSLWSSIEFCCDPYNGSVVTAMSAPQTVFDNLAVKYGGHAMEFYGIGATVQNCEVGYMGAMTHTFWDNKTLYSGDGINHGTGMVVQNNYVHDVFNSGIAPGELAYDPSPDYANTVEIQGNNIIRNNLLERTSGIVLINWETEANENHMYKNITIEGNYVMYSVASGDPTAEKSRSVTGALVFTEDYRALPCANENLWIKNNVFYCAKGALILSGMPAQYAAHYEGNTYAQYEGTAFAYWLYPDGTYKPIYTSDYADLDSFVREVIGDPTGIVLH